jgi:hypothetical protein
MAKEGPTGLEDSQPVSPKRPYFFARVMVSVPAATVPVI